MRRLSREEGSHSISFSPGMQFYIDRFSRASVLPELSRDDRTGKRLMTLSRNRDSSLASMGLRYPEFLTIPARDGFSLPAQILKPSVMGSREEVSGHFLCVRRTFSAHGCRCLAARDLLENILLQNGYLVVRRDNRSATGISKSLENLVLHRLVGDVELNDLVDAARYVKGLPFVDSARIGIWGWSGGRSNTLLGMTRSQEFKAGIAVAGVTLRFYDTKWAEQVMETERENAEGFRSVSLLRYAKDLHGTLLIVHGTYDGRRTHPEHVRVRGRVDCGEQAVRDDGLSDAYARHHRPSGTHRPLLDNA